MRQLGCRQGTGKELKNTERAFTLRLLPLTLQSCLCLALCPIDHDPQPGHRAASPPRLCLMWGSWLSLLHPRAAPLRSRGLAWVGQVLPSSLIP